MALEIGRVAGAAEVAIDYARCVACGLCVKVCKGGPLDLHDGRVTIDPARHFGCMACGHCMAVCPRECITVTGRDLSPADMLAMPAREGHANYAALLALMQSRRSIRNYQDREVPHDVVERIIRAASSAPMGIPPSEVGVLVLEGREKVRRFKDALLVAAKSMKKTMSPFMLTLLRPFLGRETYQMMRTFVLPVLDTYLKKDAEGGDWFFYEAPLALYFYGSPWADPADATIAATYAVLAGESLGLGSCVLGFPGHLLKYNRRLKEKYHLPKKMTPGVAVVFGYPAVAYRRTVERRFADVRFV